MISISINLEVVRMFFFNAVSLVNSLDNVFPIEQDWFFVLFVCFFFVYLKHPSFCAHHLSMLESGLELVRLFILILYCISCMSLSGTIVSKIF